LLLNLHKKKLMRGAFIGLIAGLLVLLSFGFLAELRIGNTIDLHILDTFYVLTYPVAGGLLIGWLGICAGLGALIQSRLRVDSSLNA
jgi:hypothetical protein